jgi:hypothetical protein
MSQTLMKQFSSLLSVLLFAASLSLNACTVVRVDQPVGTNPVSLNPNEWNGAWVSDNSVIHLTVDESKKGLLTLSWIENKGDDTKKALALSASVHIRESENAWLYASVLDPDKVENEKGKVAFWWGRIKKLDDRIIVWAPVASKFADAVTAGELPGTVEDDKYVWLSNLGPKHLEFIEDDETQMLFAWDAPGIYDRVAK